MKQVFDPTVAEIIKLVQTQKTDIEKTGKKLDVRSPLDPSQSSTKADMRSDLCWLAALATLPISSKA